MQIKIALLTLALLAGALPSIAARCLTAAPSCTEWVTLEGSSRSVVYTTYSLETKNENITRALVVVQGAGRDADKSFRTGIAAGFLAGALENTVIIAPHFASNEKISDDQLASQLAKRPVTYLLGEIDILPLGGFARGQAFQKYIAEKLKTNQKLQVVHLCGHNARCMFTAEESLPILFPKQ